MTLIYPAGAMDEEQLKPLLATAVQAALAAAVPIRRYFGAPEMGLEAKRDGSPVTLADREAECVIRMQLATAPGMPLDILGEEEGLSGTGTRWRWTVDPIDGTRSFVRGIPRCGSMIGLEDTADGRALLGVIHLPMLGVTYAGAAGLGASRNGEPIRLPDSVTLEDAIIGTGDVAQFAEAGDWKIFAASQHCTATYAAIGLLRPRPVIEALGAMLDRANP
jgi:myo-inositol-1(or 4)-monophosphatase